MTNSDDDAAAGAAVLARIRGGEGTIPAEVLALMLDDGLSPLAAWRRYRGISEATKVTPDGVA